MSYKNSIAANRLSACGSYEYKDMIRKVIVKGKNEEGKNVYEVRGTGVLTEGSPTFFLFFFFFFLPYFLPFTLEVMVLSLECRGLDPMFRELVSKVAEGRRRAENTFRLAVHFAPLVHVVEADCHLPDAIEGRHLLFHPSDPVGHSAKQDAGQGTVTLNVALAATAHTLQFIGLSQNGLGPGFYPFFARGGHLPVFEKKFKQVILSVHGIDYVSVRKLGIEKQGLMFVFVHRLVFEIVKKAHLSVPQGVEGVLAYAEKRNVHD